MELAEFLRARLDEDERVAREASLRSAEWPVGGTWNLEGIEHNVVGFEEAFCHPHNVAHISRHDPARVLREVEAKRRIVDKYAYWAGLAEGGIDSLSNHMRGEHIGWLYACLALALPYADHPDYREEWRP